VNRRRATITAAVVLAAAAVTLPVYLYLRRRASRPS
jgi:hypothetical protein